MKRKKTGIGIILIILLICFGSDLRAENYRGKEQTILFTHDMHDHFLPAAELKGEEVEYVGGYARLKTAIDIQKNIDPEALLVDAGDYSMGTLFQAIYTSHSPGLRVMGQMGYDVTTLGNHEFDFRVDGLTRSLEAAIKSGDPLPQMVQANTVFSMDKGGVIPEELVALKEAMKAYGVKPYTIINKNGIKIGVFGIMGIEAASNAPMSGVAFSDPVERSKTIVKELQDKVDMIICLSHSGTNDDSKKSEDELLAKSVPGIDIIISGHTHSVLEEPIIIGNTHVVSAGEYTNNLGVLKVKQTKQGRWALENYSLKPLDKTVAEDLAIVQTNKTYKEKIEADYLNQYNLFFDQVLAESKFNFTAAKDIGKEHKEEPLANLIGDAYRYAVKQVEGDGYESIAAALVPSGTIRGSFTKGPITASDVFTVSSLGIGADGIPGYPLISVYLTGKEIKTLCETDASIAPIMSSAQLYIAGLSYSFNPNRMLFDKVTRVNLQAEDGSLETLQDDQLYRIIAGLYSGQMLSVVGEKSFGILSIVPKDKNGVPITDFEKCIIKNKDQTELKEWLAIARYMESFEKVDDMPQVPMQYAAIEGRKIIETDCSLWARVKNPSKITIGIFATAIVIVGILMTIFIIVVKKVKKKYKKSKAYDKKTF